MTADEALARVAAWAPPKGPAGACAAVLAAEVRRLRAALQKETENQWLAEINHRRNLQRRVDALLARTYAVRGLISQANHAGLANVDVVELEQALWGT